MRLDAVHVIEVKVLKVAERLGARGDVIGKKT
jgi:hypothetical protein